MPCPRALERRVGRGIGLAGLAALTALLAGCPGNIDDTQFGVCDAERAVLQAKCARAGCHGAVGAAASLDLASPGLLGRLIGAPAATAMQGGVCEGRGPLVDRSAPSRGLLFEKLGPTPPCGERMPPSGARLSVAEVSCLERWLAAGIADAAVAAPSDAGQTSSTDAGEEIDASASGG